MPNTDFDYWFRAIFVTNHFSDAFYKINNVYIQINMHDSIDTRMHTLSDNKSSISDKVSPPEALYFLASIIALWNT